jgi:hypothetical protein
MRASMPLQTPAVVRSTFDEPRDVDDRIRGDTDKLPVATAIVLTA